MIHNGRKADLPALVKSFCYSHSGFIVGSGAAYLLGLSDKLPKDWDILIPFRQWHLACKSIPKGTTVNSMGGWKIQGEVNIDIWPGDLDQYATQLAQKYLPARVVHPASGLWLEINN